MTVQDRFLDFVRYDTQSSEDSTTTPSTAKQLVFARHLRDLLVQEGLSDIVLDDKGYLYATLPSNIPDDTIPTVGFISHYDTSPDASGENIRPRVIHNYDGGDIALSETVTMSPERFPELTAHIGEDLIVTDGTTLLGADDKAGIAEIIQAVCFLRDNPTIPHGTIRLAFNPDEEIGMGARQFNVPLFHCDWAYTIDGGDLGELEYENFNAAAAKIYIRGVSVHPGYAKGKMINASRVAAELLAMLPADETPETTDGYDGFYHLTQLVSTVEKAEMTFIIRDHDRTRFEQRKVLLATCAKAINERYHDNLVECNISDQYYNMKEVIDKHYHTIDIALQAYRNAGVVAKVQPIRGGTDGAQLSFMGLPCPNIFAGGVNFHGPYEFVSIQVMEKATQVIVEICKLVAQRHK